MRLSHIVEQAGGPIMRAANVSLGAPPPMPAPVIAPTGATISGMPIDTAWRPGMLDYGPFGPVQYTPGAWNAYLQAPAGADLPEERAYLRPYAWNTAFPGLSPAAMDYYGADPDGTRHWSAIWGLSAYDQVRAPVTVTPDGHVTVGMFTGEHLTSATQAFVQFVAIGATLASVGVATGFIPTPAALAATGTTIPVAESLAPGETLITEAGAMPVDTFAAGGSLQDMPGISFPEVEPTYTPDFGGGISFPDESILQPIPDFSAPIPDIPAIAGSDLYSALNQIKQVVAVGLQAVQAFKNAGNPTPRIATPTALPNGQIAIPHVNGTITVGGRTTPMPVGQPFVFADGSAVVNNGDGSYTTIRPDGSTVVARYGSTSIMGVPWWVWIGGGAALLLVLGRRS